MKHVSVTIFRHPHYHISVMNNIKRQAVITEGIITTTRRWWWFVGVLGILWSWQPCTGTPAKHGVCLLPEVPNSWLLNQPHFCGTTDNCVWSQFQIHMNGSNRCAFSMTKWSWWYDKRKTHVAGNCIISILTIIPFELFNFPIYAFTFQWHILDSFAFVTP